MGTPFVIVGLPLVSLAAAALVYVAAMRIHRRGWHLSPLRTEDESRRAAPAPGRHSRAAVAACVPLLAYVLVALLAEGAAVAPLLMTPPPALIIVSAATFAWATYLLTRLLSRWLGTPLVPWAHVLAGVLFAFQGGPAIMSVLDAEKPVDQEVALMRVGHPTSGSLALGDLNLAGRDEFGTLQVTLSRELAQTVRDMQLKSGEHVEIVITHGWLGLARVTALRRVVPHGSEVRTLTWTQEEVAWVG